MKTTLIYIFLAVLLISLAACDDSDDVSDDLIGEVDRVFIMSAADEGLLQINAGQVASANASFDSLQDFGQLMVEDFTKANQQLQKIAADKKVETPTTLSDDRQEQLDSLSMFTGAQFDTLYIDQMNVSHSRLIRLFETEASAGKDIEVKSWAAERLPVIRAHAEQARALKDSLD
jgi:putative membrane protein